ncbi:MAG: acyltransferase [Thermoleophilaceae bacterium]|nr:acyltransferase [Thermoleophilaceae bacterium]
MGSRELQGSSRRSAPLDGLRALAAISVLVFHVWLYAPGGRPTQRTALWDKLMFELNLGLICFFVLSGFLLYQAFARASLAGERGVDVKRYAVRRAARILPAYYVCIAGCLLLYWLAGPRKMLPSAEHIPLFAVFAQNFSADTVMTFNPVTWTLAIEASLYLILPLIGLAAYRLGPRRVGFQVALLIALVGVTLLWNAAVFAGDWRPIGPKVLPAYIGHFALGMLGALWIERRRSVGSAAPGARATALLVAAGAGFVFLGGYWHETAGSGITYATFSGLPAALGFALVITAAAAGRGPAVGWLRARPLVAIGVISYGVYLWHLPLLLATRHLGLMPDPFVLRMTVVLSLALIAGAASWRLVERPLIERFGTARSGPVMAASTDGRKDDAPRQLSRRPKATAESESIATT